MSQSTQSYSADLALSQALDQDDMLLTTHESLLIVAALCTLAASILSIPLSMVI